MNPIDLKAAETEAREELREEAHRAAVEAAKERIRERAKVRPWRPSEEVIVAAMISLLAGTILGFLLSTIH